MKIVWIDDLGGRERAYCARMNPSGWLYLAGAAIAVIGLVAFWPLLLVVPFIGFGATKQRQVEKKAAIAARYAHTRRP